MSTLSSAQGASVLAHVAAFARDLEGVIGANLIGVILFGSQARGEAGPDSDIDVAIVVSDSISPDVVSGLVNATLGKTPLEHAPMALSFETYGRLKALAAAGDPFALVILADGVLLSDRNELLGCLRRDYAESDRVLDARELSGHLTHKAAAHIEKALSAFNEVLCQLQLAGMAVGQNIALGDVGHMTAADVRYCCQWGGLSERLQRSGMSSDQVSSLEAMINGHKHIRLQRGDYPGADVVSSLMDLRALLRSENAAMAA